MIVGRLESPTFRSSPFEEVDRLNAIEIGDVRDLLVLRKNTSTGSALVRDNRSTRGSCVGHNVRVRCIRLLSDPVGEPCRNSCRKVYVILTDVANKARVSLRPVVQLVSTSRKLVQDISADACPTVIDHAFKGVPNRRKNVSRIISVEPNQNIRVQGVAQLAPPMR